MTQHYPKPIAPPPELSDEQVGEWLIDDDYPWDPSEQAVITITPSRLKNVARQAYQAGADQELEACVAFVKFHEGESLARDLRKTRRPKPLSLKEQALALLEHLDDAAASQMDTTEAVQIIGLALEQIND